MNHPANTNCYAQPRFHNTQALLNTIQRLQNENAAFRAHQLATTQGINNEIRRRQAENTNLKIINTNLNANNAAITAQKVQLNHQLVSAVASTHAECNAQIRDQTSMNNTLRNERTQLHTDLSSLQAQNNELLVKNYILERENDNLKEKNKKLESTEEAQRKQARADKTHEQVKRFKDNPAFVGDKKSVRALLVFLEQEALSPRSQRR